MSGYEGGNPSPSEHAGLLSRWKSFGKEFGALATDTVKAMVYSVQQDTLLESKTPSPQRVHRSASLSSIHVVEQPSPGHADNPADSQPPRNSSIARSLSRQPRRSSSPTKRASDQPNVIGTPFATSQTYPSTSGLSSHNSTTSLNGAPTSRRQQTGSNGTARGYKHREHIYAKAHKANVRAETQKSKEEMQRTIYTIKRNSGYTSNFTDFQSLLAFQAKLERLDRRDAFSPSSSMIDLHTKERESSPRRHSYSDTDDMDFLRRAFDRAKATLNEPRPPRPFQPTLEQLRISQQLKDEDIEQLLRPKLVPPTPLSPKDDVQVDILLKKKGIISKYAREQVSDADLSRLRPGQWLNDEIINFYGAMVLGRFDDGKENPPKQKTNGMQILNLHYFSTFFWPKLKEGYEKGRLAKWTKKVDIFSKDVVLIPVNHSNAHWTSAAINFRRKRIESYDSMGTRRAAVFKALRAYIDAEHRNKKNEPFDFTGWQDYSIEEPQQENGYDCGVFTCQFLQGLSRGDEVIRFTQKDMPALRRRMIWEIGNAKLRDEP
ncbi:hypothetical protein C0991_008739 [Blastosporella zonata]|nr:hypothetical protein C0991_008739 [Blastosporella zonata]